MERPGVYIRIVNRDKDSQRNSGFPQTSAPSGTEEKSRTAVVGIAIVGLMTLGKA